MPKKTDKTENSFLSVEALSKHSTLFYLNLYLGGFEAARKPYKIHYQLLMISWEQWGKRKVDEFCHRETLSYFMFNAKMDSPVAREAYYHEIKEFITGL